MYRPTQILFSPPWRPLFTHDSVKKLPSVICKLHFLHFLLEIFFFNRVYRLLSKIGITRRLSMFVLHSVLMWFFLFYLMASCILHLLCCCTTHPTSKSQRSIPVKWEEVQSPKAHE